MSDIFTLSESCNFGLSLSFLAVSLLIQSRWGYTMEEKQICHCQRLFISPAPFSDISLFPLCNLETFLLTSFFFFCLKLYFRICHFWILGKWFISTSDRLLKKVIDCGSKDRGFVSASGRIFLFPSIPLSVFVHHLKSGPVVSFSGAKRPQLVDSLWYRDSESYVVMTWRSTQRNAYCIGGSAKYYSALEFNCLCYLLIRPISQVSRRKRN